MRRVGSKRGTQAAGSNAALSFALCMVAVWAGFMVAATLNQTRWF